ncbi:MAG: sigma 54-interacting transcriptional regulator [Myxococcales bacterium]|nr:sigma 54-interacting transcriptional regulator [Myxococcales bacterium]
MSAGPPRETAHDGTTQIDVGPTTEGSLRREDRAYVLVRVGDRADVHPVEEDDRLVIGRGEDADIVVDDSRASRRHVEIALRGGRLFVKDLGSRNGTRVGTTVLKSEERALSRGDEIGVGPARVTVIALPTPQTFGPTDEVVVADARMKELFDLVERLAGVPTPVLIRGETGAGKEILAARLHERGSRRTGPLVRLNCAAVPESLIESELFGHEKGAFTGATEKKRGYLELADKGTLFLDEIGDLPLAMQAKLLRALETQRVQRVGGREELAVDVRFVCATHHDLEGMVERGAFRRDLFYRIAGFVLEVPPLRERKTEIVPLAETFTHRFAKKLGKLAPPISEGARAALLAHTWPGNVRELKNAVEHAVVLSNGAAIDATHLPRSVLERTATSGSSMQEHVDTAERAAIERALAACDGHRQRAADMLGISKRTLQYRLAKLGIKE